MYQMSEAILELGRCQASSMKICSDRLLSGGGGTMRAGGTLRRTTGFYSVLRQKELGNIYSRVCHKNTVISPPNCALASSIITLTQFLPGIFVLPLCLTKVKDAFHPNHP